MGRNTEIEQMEDDVFVDAPKNSVALWNPTFLWKDQNIHIEQLKQGQG